MRSILGMSLKMKHGFHSKLIYVPQYDKEDVRPMCWECLMSANLIVSTRY